MIKNILLFSIGSFAFLALIVTNFAQAEDKVLICHQTSSEKNPYIVLEVSSKALGAHLEHGDSLPDVETGSCKGGGPLPE